MEGRSNLQFYKSYKGLIVKSFREAEGPPLLLPSKASKIVISYTLYICTIDVYVLKYYQPHMLYHICIPESFCSILRCFFVLSHRSSSYLAHATHFSLLNFGFIIFILEKKDRYIYIHI